MKKMSLHSVASFSFTLCIVISKIGACQQSESFPQTTVFMKFTAAKLRQASFQPYFKLCDVLEFTNESRFHSYRTIIYYTEK